MSAPTRPRDYASGPAVSLSHIRQRFGFRDWSEARLVRFVQALVETKGFPPPYPYERAGVITTRVVGGSRFLGAAVDAWFDAYHSPVTDRHSTARQTAAAATRLDARAHSLAAHL